MGQLGTVLFNHQMPYPRDQVRTRIRKRFTDKLWLKINSGGTYVTGFKFTLKEPGKKKNRVIEL